MIIKNLADPKKKDELMGVTELPVSRPGSVSNKAGKFIFFLIVRDLFYMFK